MPQDLDSLAKQLGGKPAAPDYDAIAAGTGGAVQELPDQPSPATPPPAALDPGNPETPASRVLSGATKVLREDLNPLPALRLGAQALRMRYGDREAAQEVLSTADAAARASEAQWLKAKQAASQGRILPAVGHALGTVPLVGPAAAEGGEMAARGYEKLTQPTSDPTGWEDVGGAIGRTASLATPAIATKAAKLIPRVPGAKAASTALQEGARESMGRALLPTEWEASQEAKNLTFGTKKPRTAGLVEDTPQRPGLVTRDIGVHTRHGLARTIDTNVDRLGAQIEELQSAIPPETLDVPLEPVLKALDGARKKFQVETAGVSIPGSGTSQHALATIDDLRELVEAAKKPSYSRYDPTKTAVTPQGAPPLHPVPAIDYQALRRFKQIWDTEVAQAKGYSGADLANNAKIAATKEAAAAIREILDQVTPNIAEINKEYHFWKTAQKVIDKTIRRDVIADEGVAPHIANLAAAAMGGPGAGSVAKVVVRGYTLRNLIALHRSTVWNTLASTTKSRLAYQLATGDVPGANRLMSTILAASQEERQAKQNTIRVSPDLLTENKPPSTEDRTAPFTANLNRWLRREPY